jgi:hypothetical protein
MSPLPVSAVEELIFRVMDRATGYTRANNYFRLPEDGSITYISVGRR